MKIVRNNALPSASQEALETPESSRPRSTLPGSAVIVIVPTLLIFITFLFWYQTWFGRRLTDQQIERYLRETSSPRKTQHALSQLAERIARGDTSARRWFPDIVRLSANQEPQLRLMAAWVMGQDNHSEDFHQALRKLAQDPEPAVRRNAALALARFADAAGEAELRLMLRPYSLAAPEAGTVDFRLKENDSVRSGSVVARVLARGGAKPVDIRSPVAGQLERRAVKDGTSVAAGEELAKISPAEEEVWESLRALYLVGRREDLEDVERFTPGVSGMSERVRRQAALTARAIRQRAAREKTADSKGNAKAGI